MTSSSSECLNKANFFVYFPVISFLFLHVPFSVFLFLHFPFFNPLILSLHILPFLSLSHSLFCQSVSSSLSPFVSRCIYIHTFIYIRKKNSRLEDTIKSSVFFFPDETGTRPLRISMKLVFHTPFAPRHLGSSVTSQAATNATGAARDQVPNLVPWPCAATP